jgi:DNA polymerase-3 subunit alpha
MTDFCHLHLHTEYSLLNGATRISEVIKTAKDMEMKSLALTDYGNIFGAVEFFTESKKAGIHPILGCEIFIPSYDDHRLKQLRKGVDAYWTLVLLVQNKEGYRNLSHLITRAYLEGFYYRPRVSTALLKEYSQGLIALSAGLSGELNYHIHQKRHDEAKKALEKYAQIFPNRFFVELQNNGLDEQRAMNAELAVLAKDVGVATVATNNVHYLKRDDADAFEVLMGVQMGKTTLSPMDHLKFTTDGYYFKSSDEMDRDLADFPEALEITDKIAASCDFEFDFKSYHFPKYEVPADKTLDQVFEEEAKRGFFELWPQIVNVSHVTAEDQARYEDRLVHEIAVIQKMGFAGYFLIVSDFICWAKAHDIPVGPGRGSGAGSLVAYSLRITELDPLPYNLLFERFLNPERVSMPDFDIDFCQDRRGEVIEYVSQKYGNVSQIITFGKMKAKAVIRDVGRVMGLEYDFVDKVAKLIPGRTFKDDGSTSLNVTLADAMKDEPRFKELYESDDTVRRLVDTSSRLEGLSRHASVHAAGVVMTDKPLPELVPLYKGSSDDVVIQFDMKSAEKIGLIKFDFLGLKTLTVIQKAVRNIQASRGVNIDITLIPLDDKAVYENLSRGDGCGIFQLESSGMQDLMVRLGPNCFEDIVALVALYRPGPMDLIPSFIERKHGRQAVDCLDSRLESVLGPTYGIMVYQEQVMQIAQVLGGYTLGAADLLRRAMGKKDVKEMARQRAIFQAGAKPNGLNEERANHIFALMEKFAGYGFNKSHAAAYALISYQTAYLKTFFVTEYMAALMSTELEDTDKILIFISDCKKHSVEILPPDVNLSQREFSVVGDKKIRYALGALKGVGTAAIDSIREAQAKGGDFKSLSDFCMRVDLRRVTKKVIEVLIKSGAMNGFGLARKSLVEAIPHVVDAAARQQKNIQLGQNDLFGSLDEKTPSSRDVKTQSVADWSFNEVLNFEKEVFGFYFSGHPLMAFADSLTKLTTHNVIEARQVSNGQDVTLGGTLSQTRVITTKKGDRMAFAQLEDLMGKIEIIIFSRTYKRVLDLLSLDEPLIIKGNVDRSEEGAKIIVSEMTKLTDTLKETTRSIHLEIPYPIFTHHKVQRALEIIHEYQGQSPVYFHLKKAEEFEVVLDFPGGLKAMACEPLQYKLNQIFDAKVVKFE